MAAKASDVERAYEAAAFTSVQERIAAWGSATFPNGTVHGVAAHMGEEVDELFYSTRDGNAENAKDEVADIVILAIQYASVAGFNLYEAIEAKMARNRLRSWQKPDANGVVRHVREAGE